MLFTKKINGAVTKYKFLGITILRVKKTDIMTEYKLLGISVNKTTIPPDKKLDNKKLIEICSDKEVTLFFDLSLGGGTESYFFNILDKTRYNNSIVRVQYLRSFKTYKITLFDKKMEYILILKNLSLVEKFISKIPLSKIIVNNLVTWPNTYAVLELICRLKKDNVIVSIRGHDFFPVCPFFNLTKNGKFCGIPLGKGCSECFPTNKHDDISVSPGIEIDVWRDKWNYFLKNYADEIIVFSQSGRDIFTKVYPCLSNKIKIVLHDIPFLRTVKIPAHKNINIGILGSITRQSKGSDILTEIESYIETISDINMVVIGNYNNKTEKTKVIGEYKREQLPNILEKNEIDIIFIPSIWPETFSYTTSEAIIMDMPVACFNLGAPAERISVYKKGLIISTIDAKSAIYEIKKFITAGLHHGN
ncbi:glycosyltransferase [Brenneria sp. 4F2]|nr:glycosyltransferase [Brenneria bubanii]